MSAETVKTKTKTKTGPDGKGGFDLAGLISMFVIALGSVGIYHLTLGGQVAQPAVAHADSGPARGIVVVDAKTALKAFMATIEQRMAAGEDFTETHLQIQGADFGAEFLRAVKRYEDAGFIVIDKGQVLGVPPTAEITREIAEALGINIDLADEEFAAATLSGR